MAVEVPSAPLVKVGPVRKVGPTLKGVARPLEAFPPDLPEEMRAQFNELMDQKDAVLALLDPIAAQMEALRLSRTSVQKPAPAPSPASPVTGKETKAPNPQGEQGRSQGKPTHAAPTAKAERPRKGGKKKGGDKAGGGQGPSKTGSQSAPGGKGGAASSKSGGSRQGPVKGQTQASTGKTGARPAKTGAHPAEQTTPPPPPLEGEKETWSKVVGRKARKKTTEENGGTSATTSARAKAKEPSGKPQAPQPEPAESSPPSQAKGKGKRKGRRRVPRTAAVVLTCPPGQYKETLRLAMRDIDLASLDINGLKARKAVTGAQLFEVGGPDNKKKADALADRMREVLADREGVVVSRPCPTAEIRIRDLTEAVEEEDILQAVSFAGDCDPTMVKVGSIRSTGRGLSTVWVRCPLAAANRLVAAKRLRIGWVNARVEALEKRPLQCFRCMEKGHVKAQCCGEVDRSKRCYRCGNPGHAARDCTAPEHCPVCADLGRPAGHRAGSRICKAPKKKKGGPLQRSPPPMRRVRGERTP